MSAFIVSAATIDAAVSAIYDYLSHRSWNQLQGDGVMIGTVLLRDKSDLPKLAQELVKLNCDAVDQRYNEKNAVDLHQFRYVTALNPTLGVKQVSCLLYQCFEGDVPERQIYRDLQRIESEMCRAIVTRSPAYERAPWGCDESHLNRGIVSLCDLAAG